MKANLFKKLCQSIGLASLMLVMNYGELLGGGADMRMHVPFSLRSVIFAQIADIIVLGLIIFAVLAILRQTRYFNWAKVVLAIVVPPYLLWRMQLLMPFVVEDGLVPIVSAAWAALLLLLMLKFPRWYRQLLRAGDAIGVFLAIFAVISMVQLLWVASWKPGPQQSTAAWQKAPQVPRQHPLVVWIVFDELSYDQIFEHRARDLALPNFDALRAQSTLFTNVQPIGYKTVKIIPSLFTGKTVDDFRYKFDNRFLVHYTGEPGWQPLDGSSTIFHDAQQQGWRTAVVGWYNPYCTTYGDAIDACYWNNLDRIDGPMSQKNSFLRNSYLPLRQMLREGVQATRAGRDACDYDVGQRINTQLDLQQHSTQLLKGDQADFVFLHMSIPHSPNIWSRLNGSYAKHCDSSYLDNLALVDRTLGDVMKTLRGSPRWNDTTLIVEGDHGWRIDLWNWLPNWTNEDDEAARGVFDPRPALLVHQAAQTQPGTVSQPWPLLNLHDVLEQVVHGQTVNYQ